MNENKKGVRAPIRTIKAKNPVAKNASKAIGGGAAGAHKDKKKASKQGNTKHKKKEVAESYEDRLTHQLNELSIDSLKSYKAKRQVQQDAAKAATPNPRTGDKDWIDQAVRGINMNTAQKKINRKEKAVKEGGYDYHKPDPAWVTINGKRWKWFFNYVSARKAMDTLNAKFRAQGSTNKADWTPADLEDDPAYGIKIGERQDSMAGVGMGNYVVDEDEGDKEGLEHLTPELAQHIADQIDSEGVHAIVKSVEWGDGAAVELAEFIKAALLKFANADVKEDSALTQHRKRSAQADADFAKREAERKKNPGKQLGKNLNDLEKRYPKEGWTHDSLADRLFEHERTYEEQLAGKLARQLKK